MKITADTNLLVRAVTGDDPRQSALAMAELSTAGTVALTTTALCELVWVLSRGYGHGLADIAAVIRRLLAADNVVFERPATDAGLALLEAGGDFADGVIAFQGGWLGGETFVSFDRKAVALIAAGGGAARTPT